MQATGQSAASESGQGSSLDGGQQRPRVWPLASLGCALGLAEKSVTWDVLNVLEQLVDDRLCCLRNDEVGPPFPTERNLRTKQEKFDRTTLSVIRVGEIVGDRLVVDGWRRRITNRDSAVSAALNMREIFRPAFRAPARRARHGPSYLV